jgi:hypothetical protein
MNKQLALAYAATSVATAIAAIAVVGSAFGFGGDPPDPVAEERVEALASVDMSWQGAAMPGSSVYLTGPVALGTIGMWGTALLALSGWLQRRMNYVAWRVLHASAFGTFIISLVHGVVSGTDSDTMGAQVLYASTAALLIGAIVFRVLYFPAKPARAGKTARPVAQPVEAPESESAAA